MKILNFICDKCKRIVASQKANFKEVEEQHLLPMGYQEWCRDCVRKFNQELLWTPNKSKINFTIKPNEDPISGNE